MQFRLRPTMPATYYAEPGGHNKAPDIDTMTVDMNQNLDTVI